MKTFYKIIMLCICFLAIAPVQAQLFGGQIKTGQRFPPVFITTTSMLTGQHVSAAELPFFYDDLVTYVSQDVVVPDMKNLRFHQDNGDVLQTVFNTPIPPGGRLVITWSKIEVGLAQGLGFIVELLNNGVTSQATLNTISNVNLFPNATQTAVGNDVTLTINIIAPTNTLILRSSQDATGLDPILLEIEVFDNNNVKIPVN